MTGLEGSGNAPHATSAASGVQEAYDAIATAYDAQFQGELDRKPLDRALLQALADLVAVGLVADVGCGPGHVTRFLASRHPDVLGLDLSVGMIEQARRRSPGLLFAVGSMLRLPAADAGWSGLVALYSIIHLAAPDRAAACREFARVVRPGGWLLIAFHIDSPDVAAGDIKHLSESFGEPVDVDTYFLEPEQVTREVVLAGFTVMTNVIRQPSPDIEFPSRRCYLLARRN